MSLSSSSTSGGIGAGGGTNDGHSFLSSRARAAIGQWAVSANHAVQQLTAKKYTLPDKNVASQVLMYRQLLHTKCRPNLKLSRDYQGTPAQIAVLHMPWWSEEVPIQESGKMVISYDNLITRLWCRGAMNTTKSKSTENDDNNNDKNKNDDNKNEALLEPNEKGVLLPPIPHDYWVSRLGFQQPDPVTDFRSGGVLSLAMMVWIVESCPHVYQRFARFPSGGDASILPFGITCINVTDMMAKFLMLSKSTDRMDALLSQKPFWKMFADPSALLASQELAMDMLADVVQELYQVRQAEWQARNHNNNNNDNNMEQQQQEPKVTVFDFSHILAVTEKRVEFDLLGAGPTTVDELRQIHAKLKLKYQNQLQQKLLRVKNSKYSKIAARTTDQQLSSDTSSGTNNNKINDDINKQEQEATTKPVLSHQQSVQRMKEQVLKQATGLGTLAGSIVTKIKAPQPTQQQASKTGFFHNPFAHKQQQQQQQQQQQAPVHTSAVNFAMEDPHEEEEQEDATSNPTTTMTTEDVLLQDFLGDTDDNYDEWNTTTNTATTDIQNGNFAIDDDENLL